MRKHHCERLVREHFHLHLPVDELLFDDIATGERSYVVLFRSGRHLYGLFVDEGGQQMLGDVRSMMQHMGMKPLKVLPPLADSRYFLKEAKKRFSLAFPAIKASDAETIRYYQTYALYAPGLVRIAEIRGPIKRYSSDTSHWQSAFDYSFRRVQVA